MSKSLDKTSKSVENLSDTQKTYGLIQLAFARNTQKSTKTLSKNFTQIEKNMTSLVKTLDKQASSLLRLRSQVISSKTKKDFEKGLSDWLGKVVETTRFEKIGKRTAFSDKQTKALVSNVRVAMDKLVDDMSKSMNKALKHAMISNKMGENLGEETADFIKKGPFWRGLRKGYEKGIKKGPIEFKKRRTKAQKRDIQARSQLFHKEKAQEHLWNFLTGEDVDPGDTIGSVIHRDWNKQRLTRRHMKMPTQSEVVKEIEDLQTKTTTSVPRQTQTQTEIVKTIRDLREEIEETKFRLLPNIPSRGGGKPSGSFIEKWAEFDKKLTKLPSTGGGRLLGGDLQEILALNRDILGGFDIKEIEEIMEFLPSLMRISSLLRTSKQNKYARERMKTAPKDWLPKTGGYISDWKADIESRTQKTESREKIKEIKDSMEKIRKSTDLKDLPIDPERLRAAREYIDTLKGKKKKKKKKSVMDWWKEYFGGDEEEWSFAKGTKKKTYCPHLNTKPLTGGGDKYKEGYMFYCPDCGELFEKDPMAVLKYLFSDDEERNFAKGTQNFGYVKIPGGVNEPFPITVHGKEHVQVLPAGIDPPSFKKGTGNNIIDSLKKIYGDMKSTPGYVREKVGESVGEKIISLWDRLTYKRDDMLLPQGGWIGSKPDPKDLKAEREAGILPRKRQHQSQVGKLVEGTFDVIMRPLKTIKRVLKPIGKRFPKFTEGMKSLGRLVGMGLLGKAAQQLIEIVNAMNPLKVISAAVTEIFSVYGEILETAFMPLVQKLFEFMFSEEMMEIIESMTTLFLKLAEALMPMVEAILPIFQGLLAGLTPIIESLSYIFLQLTPVIKVLASVFGAIFAAMGPVIGILIKAFVPAIKVIGTVAVLAGVAIIAVMRIVMGIVNFFRKLAGKEAIELPENIKVGESIKQIWSPKSQLEGYASGGIVTQPTVGLLGESGTEGVFRIDNQGNIATGGVPGMVSPQVSGSQYTLNFYGNVDSMHTVNQINEELWKYDIRTRRRLR